MFVCGGYLDLVSSGCLIVCMFVCENCSSATNRLITSKDHASVQINVGHLDESGVYTGHFTTFALCGFVRAQVLDLTRYALLLGFNSHLSV